MTAHLLALAIGPVQEFIVAARRTRDLWFGSYLLCEISKAAARAVHGDHGRLIFPAPVDDSDLSEDSAFNAANVIVAELDAPRNPGDVAQAARNAVRARWRAFADRTFTLCQPVIVPDIWNSQVDDIVELYAVWHPFTPATYREDRIALMRLLAARKRCRDFVPANGYAGVRKSSLDGLRETVLLPPDRRPAQSGHRLRLREGEELDVVGAVKRGWSPAGGVRRYPSVARVAADTWLRSIPDERLAALAEVCGAAGEDVIHPLDISQERGHPHYRAFPYEGTAVFRSRHRDICREAEVVESTLAPLARSLADLTRDFGEPSPYLAVLVADGDRMGQALSALASPEEHRAFSQALAGFAGGARRIVDDHSGVLAYAGGDDVLAFLPTDRCLDCGRALHDAFAAALQTWSTATGTPLTLSIGIAIAHFMEPLEDLLEHGRMAEKHAKRPTPEDTGQSDRDGLAIHIVKRGGEPLVMRAGWSGAPDARLTQIGRWLAAGDVPRGVAYDLCKVADLYDSWPADEAAPATRADALAVIRRKQPRGDGQMAEIATLIERRVTGPASLRNLAKELLVARQLIASPGSTAP